MITINPALDEVHYFNEEFQQNTYHFPFVYLHGMVRDYFSTDKCGIVNLNPNTLKPGMYECKVLGTKQDCMLFLWKTEHQNKGLIVYQSDLEALQIANDYYQKEITNL